MLNFLLAINPTTSVFIQDTQRRLDSRGRSCEDKGRNHNTAITCQRAQRAVGIQRELEEAGNGGGAENTTNTLI